MLRLLTSSFAFFATLLLCVAFATDAQAQCNETCVTAGDGECDDGGPASLYAICALGSDCADCGPRGDFSDPAAPVAGTQLCTDTCVTAGDGECDDGGENSAFEMCGLGTDCTDCGARMYGAPVEGSGAEGADDVDPTTVP